MSENRRQSEISIVINDKSQGSIIKLLSCGGLLHYKLSLALVCHHRFCTDNGYRHRILACGNGLLTDWRFVRGPHFISSTPRCLTMHVRHITYLALAATVLWEKYPASYSYTHTRPSADIILRHSTISVIRGARLQGIARVFICR